MRVMKNEFGVREALLHRLWPLPFQRPVSKIPLNIISSLDYLSICLPAQIYVYPPRGGSVALAGWVELT